MNPLISASKPMKTRTGSNFNARKDGSKRQVVQARKGFLNDNDKKKHQRDADTFSVVTSIFQSMHKPRREKPAASAAPPTKLETKVESMQLQRLLGGEIGSMLEKAKIQ